MSVISGILGASAAEDAADSQASASQSATAAQSASTADANKMQLQMYEEGRADTAPWRAAGEAALNTLVSKVNAGPGAYTSSPGYDFRVGEGAKAIDRSAAARGGVLSGRAGKELTRFGQDYATNDYQNFLSNYYNSLTPYQSLSGVGQTTASQNATQGNQVGGAIGQNTMNLGNSTANNLIAAGNAQAGGAINQANAITGASNTGVNNYLNWKYINSRTPASNSASYVPADMASYNAIGAGEAGAWGYVV